VIFGKFPGFPLCPSDGRNMQKNVRMEHDWNDIDRGTPNFSERKLSQCHFANQNSDIYGPWIEPVSPRRDASDKPHESWQFLTAKTPTKYK